MRATLLVLAVVAGCATSTTGIDVRPHACEVARIPHPAYHRDGVQVTRLPGDSPWTRAGVVVNDVIESVNGAWTPDEAAFRKAVGERARKVRIASSHAGPVGHYRIVAIEVS